MAITVTEEQRQQTPLMDVEQLAKFLFCRLKERIASASHSAVYFSVVKLRKDLFPSVELRKDLPPGEQAKQESDENQQSSDNHSKLLEAIALLERRGLVVRDSSAALIGDPWLTKHNCPPPIDGSIVSVYLTSIDMKSDFDDEILLLVDKPEEIVSALEQKIGTLDDVVRQYYLESLRAYQEGLYISSVICLGAASERAIHWLAESVKADCTETDQKNIEKRLNGNISVLTEYLSNNIIPNLFEDDKKFKGELKNRLDGLGKVYRENRNEAGHPKTVDQSWLREDQEMLLLHFRRYITTIGKAIDECRAS